jgi:hypothetical protein
MDNYNEGLFEMNWMHAFFQSEQFQHKVYAAIGTPRGKRRQPVNLEPFKISSASESHDSLSEKLGSFRSQDFSLNFIPLSMHEKELPRLNHGKDNLLSLPSVRGSVKNRSRKALSENMEAQER